MKKILALLILSAITVAPVLVNSSIFIYYSVDIQSFTEKYCSNISKPELHCNGKCQLKKIVITPRRKEQKPESKGYFNPILFLNKSLTDVSHTYETIPAVVSGFWFITNRRQVGDLDVSVPPPRF